MMDDFRDRTIFRIFNSVIEGSSHVAPCPTREKSNWRRFWGHLRKKNVNDKEFNEIKHEHKIAEEIYKPSEEIYKHSEETYNSIEKTNVVADIETLCGTTYCTIKMQDPCEICCCKVCRVEEESVCEGVPRGRRQSICECHPDEKYQKDHTCCDACEHHGLKRV